MDNQGVLEAHVKQQKQFSPVLPTATRIFDDPYPALKNGIWVYFILLIFEGALRKWVLPGLAAPLLIVRDPVAIWLIVVAWRRGVLKSNFSLSATFAISILALVTSLMYGHGNLLVYIYGVRTLLLHFVVIFIIGNVFNRDDVLKIGKALMWITIPMTVLVILQFYSPQSAWVNLGVGGDTAGGGFSGALGYFRPPATFSFITGTALFYSLSACFIFYFWLSPKKHVKKIVLITASVALAIAIPMSISRTLFFMVVVTAIFVLIAFTRNARRTGTMITVALAILVIFVVLSQLSFFQTATDAFSTRFSNASELEGGLSGTVEDRYLGGLLGAFNVSAGLPFFGYGIGMGTNVGSQLLTGENQFLIAEGEWGRLVGELGLVLGLAIIIIRLGLTIKIAILSFKKLAIGDFLPWILTSYCFLTVPQGQWAQPTTLGFSVFVAGLAIASFAVSKPKDEKNRFTNKTMGTV
jgi:hypothetical protein